MKNVREMSSLIIPAIDIIGGECVRLTRGDYGRKKVYGTDIVEAARRFEEVGVKRLHCVDLDGARAGEPRNLDVLERLAASTSMLIEWGGGMSSAEVLRRTFDAGAAKVICGSVAVKSPDKFSGWLREFGPDRIILGADVRGDKVAVHGWLEDSGTTIRDLIDRFMPDGLAEVICTDISRDGMLQGPAFGLYRDLTHSYPRLGIIASGGVSSVDDIFRLACGTGNEADGPDHDGRGVRGVIIGKAFYEGRITLNDLRKIISTVE